MKSFKNRQQLLSQAQGQQSLAQLLKQIQIQQILQKQQQNPIGSLARQSDSVADKNEPSLMKVQGQLHPDQSNQEVLNFPVLNDTSAKNAAQLPKSLISSHEEVASSSSAKSAKNMRVTKSKKPKVEGHETISEILAAKQKPTRRPQQKISAMFKINTNRVETCGVAEKHSLGSQSAVIPTTAVEWSKLDAVSPTTSEKVKGSIIQQLRSLKDQQHLQQILQKIPATSINALQLSAPQLQPSQSSSQVSSRHK